MTRLSHIHPYPAMIADELAVRLSREVLKAGRRVLDPFCGTGRTLMAAAEQGAHCVGVDVNPLATLLTRAKASRPQVRVLEKLLLGLGKASGKSHDWPVWNFDLDRKVEWFSSRAKRELSRLIGWINDLRMDGDTLTFVAAVVSATVREVSYCRNDQWKLHRIPRKARAHFYKSPWIVFERRLRSALRELARASDLTGTVHVVTGDARRLSRVLRPFQGHKGFDVVFTSPPYGDSRTTVQYGGMSSISLGVLRHLRGLDLEIVVGGEIDRRCLGGRPVEPRNADAEVVVNQPKYWRAGIQNSARSRVRRFLWDIELCCKEISTVLRHRGRAVIVVARRSVGGWRLNLDRFLVDVLAGQGVQLERVDRRRILHKTTPPVINSHGRMPQKEVFGRRVSTMREEQILVFRKA